MNVAIVVSAYHREITSKMLEAAKARLDKHGASLADVVLVAGSFELPLAVNRLLSKSGVDGVVTLGFIERGETLHGEALGNAVASALLGASLAANKPVSFGIIGPGATHEQARERVEKVAKEAVDAVLGK